MVNAVEFAAAIDGSDLVKIDVEGLEAQLLVSAWAQLCAVRPALMVEIHGFNRDLRSLVPRLMLDLDAVAYAMRRDHLVPSRRTCWLTGSCSTRVTRGTS